MGFHASRGPSGRALAFARPGMTVRGAPLRVGLALTPALATRKRGRTRAGSGRAHDPLDIPGPGASHDVEVARDELELLVEEGDLDLLLRPVAVGVVEKLAAVLVIDVAVGGVVRHLADEER